MDIFAPALHMIFQFFIFFIRYRLTPLIGGFLARYLNGKMTEPAVSCGAMPMLYFCRNVDAVARLHLNCLFAFFLIVTASCHTDKNLSTAIFCVVNVPVVAAARFKSHIENANLTG